ncbi:WecB/TagA/CpsF family glycosyltransferase [Butyrivibrio sp. VCB2001]|uniref:WecB/TagA/CpsF family glycosyltransferase n=1 Tax=Butyrivibrio sp. VCB2001 TaxID=1280667 RepID=UPI001FA7464F|nr:WecB/TagA/CpsF family glycosyltransferase [Butyrivibrio sp. VCB2001]
MKNRTNYPIIRVFIIDEIAIIMAMAIALLVRYGRDAIHSHSYFNGIYVSVVITMCVFHVIVYLLYDTRKTSIFIQDPIENFATVFKSRCILVTLAFVYHYAIHMSTDSSRAVMATFFVLSVLIGYVLRMLYRRHHIRKYGTSDDWKILKVEYPYPKTEELKKMLSDGDYNEILIMTRGVPEADLEKMIKEAEDLGIRAFCSISALNYTVKPGIIADIRGYSAIPAFVRKEKFPLFGVNYSIAKTEEAVLHVIRHIKELSGKYICFSNVHTSVMARENKEYADILNESAFTFPDGNPIATLQRKSRIKGASRVAGPDFMEHMFRDTRKGQISHFFYGAKQETLDALKANLESKYPGIIIKGLYSPPFRDLTPEEDQADIDMINAAGADIVWIGLGAPKQEKWMKAHEGKVHGVMMGVGAGFDFHAGTIKRAPKWIQKIGFEWLYRLLQDPKRLISRYFVTNIKFMWYIAIDYMFGKRV